MRFPSRAATPAPPLARARPAPARSCIPVRPSRGLAPRGEYGMAPGQLRPLARGLDERLAVLIEKLHRPAAAILQPHGEAAGAAEPGDRRRAERERRRLRDLRRQGPVQAAQDLTRLQ